MIGIFPIRGLFSEILYFLENQFLNRCGESHGLYLNAIYVAILIVIIFCFTIFFMLFFLITHTLPRRKVYYTLARKYHSEVYSFTFPKFIPDVTEMLTDILHERVLRARQKPMIKRF